MNEDPTGSDFAAMTDLHSPPGFRCGFATLAGRPNVGKSTLLNALLARKVSIVTPKPQTTRHRIAGVLTTPAAQVVFLDTPGLHRGARRAMNRQMNRVAAHALAEADLILFLVSALQWTDEDEDVLERLREQQVKTFLVVNKVDRVSPKERLLPFIQEVSARGDFAEVFPVSALKRDNLEPLLERVIYNLPESKPLYPPGQVTDRSDAFQAAEIIREKLMWKLQQELPYDTGVEIESYEDDSKLLRIAAVIWVERAGQKAIVIGKGGTRLKEIGQSARLELERMKKRKVYVELWVRVKENWSDDERALRRLGYDT